MNFLVLPIIATVLTAISFLVRKRWLCIFVSAVILLMISYILFFYTGTVARFVVQPGPPEGTSEEVFYIGIRRLQDALLPSYLVVIYLALLAVLAQAAAFYDRLRSNRSTPTA